MSDERVRILVQWEAPVGKWGHIWVDREQLESKAAIIEAIEEADPRTWDTDPGVGEQYRKLRWEEDTP